MSPEKAKILYARYPAIFRRNKDELPPVFCAIGFEDGWSDLLDELCRTLEKIRQEFDVSIYAQQIKEKFGTIRFYYHINRGKDSPRNETSRIYGFIDPKVIQAVEHAVRQAKAMSEKTCEITGKEGKLRDDLPWRKCLCDEEYQKVKPPTSSQNTKNNRWLI